MNFSRLKNTLIGCASSSTFAYLFTIVIFLLTLLGRLMYNGLVFGFDYGLFHPDGSLYAFRSLLFAGYSELEAGREVASWYETNSFKAKYEGPELYFENNPFLWDQYITRVMYPLISTPFVMLIGVPGMLVVPSLTLLIVMLVTTRVSIVFGVPAVGSLLALLVSSSTSITRWMFANITDGLLLLYVSLFILMIAKKNTLDLSRFQTFFLLVLISMSAFTRFSAFLWIGVAFLFLLYRKFFSAILITIVTILSHLPIFLQPFTGHVLPGHNDKSIFEKILIYPINLLRVTIYEIGQLFVLDRILLILIMVGLILAIQTYRELSSQLFLMSGVMLWLTGSINGVLGVNYRYQLPLTPILLYLLSFQACRFLSKKSFGSHDIEKV